MRLNSSALMRAIGISVGIFILFTIINYGLLALLGVTPFSVPDPNTIDPAVGAVTLAMSCVGYLLYGAFGALYAFFARREDPNHTVGMCALGGMVTAAAPLLLSLILSIISLAATGPQLAATFNDPSLSPEYTGLVQGSAVAGGLIGLCIGLVLALGFGAAGGTLYGLITGRAAAPPAQTPAV